MNAGNFQRLPWRFRGLGVFAAVLFIYLYVPLIILLAFSFNGGNQATIWEGFSTHWYSEVIRSASFRDAAMNSLIVALCAASLATAMASIGAVGFRGKPLRGQGAMLPVLAVPLVIPEIVTAVATLVFFVAIGLPLGMVGLILAHSVFCIPFAFITIRARLSQMDSTLEQAAGDLYATPRRTFFAVTLPLMWPAVLSGFILAFIVSLDNFVISLFLSGPNSTTLPIYMYGMIRLGVTPAVNAISALMLGLSVAFIILAAVVTRLNKT